MRNPIIAAVMLPALLLAAPLAGGDEPKAENTQTIAKMTEKKEREFSPPPGFRTRKRGEHVVYCRREEPKGTRFPTEVCYDQQALRDMKATELEDQAKLDQTRRIMGTDHVR